MSLACDLNISITKKGILKGISNKYFPEEYKNNIPDFKDNELQIPLKGKSKTEVTEIFEPILSTIEKDYKGNIKGQIVKNSASDPFYIKFNVNRDYIVDQLQLTVKDINDLQTTETIDIKVVDPLLNVQRGLSDPLIRQKYFSEGDTTTDKEVLTKIANSSHPLNQLAKHLIKYAKGIPIRLVPEIISIDPQTNEEKNSAGVYKQIDLFTEEIQINEFINFKEMGVEPTIIHEILHSLSVTWLNNINKKDPLYLEFKKYYNEALQNKELQSLNENEGYGLTNEKEFLVALFTDAKLINKLKEIPASEPTKYKNKLEEIYNFILSLFKIKENSSIYSEAFAVASNIIEEQFDLNNKLIDNLKPYSDDLFQNYNLDESFNSGLKNYKPSELKVSITEKPIVQELKTTLIPDNIEEQFAEAKKLENKIPENNEEFNKKILYSSILPNISYDRFLNVFSQTNPEEFNKYRQEKIKKIIDSFAKKFGITIETINTFQDRYAIANNKSISYNGVANLANKTIKYLDGDNNALTEEVAHFMVAMLDKNGPEYLALKNYITQTEEYQLYYDSYLEVYNGDVDKTEEEIMGKVVANSLLGISEKAPLSLKSIIKQIFNKIKSFLTPQYKREFTKALDNINHLFFTENFDTAFNEANITFDEFYQLDFLNNSIRDKIQFTKTSNQILKTFETNLQRQKTKFIQSKQTDLVKRTDTLIKILNSEDTNLDNAEILKNFIELSAIQLQRVKNDFINFTESGVIRDLEEKDFSKLSREEQEAQTSESRVNNLNYIASAISTVQSLYSFIELIEENFNVINRDLQSLKSFKEIIKNLPDTQENSSFKEIFNLISNDDEKNSIQNLKNTYKKISQDLLKVVFNALSTAEQKKFLEITSQTEVAPNIDFVNDKVTEINYLSTVKDYFVGRFNYAYKAARTNLMPLSFQSDIFLVNVDNANAAIRQIMLMRTTKKIYEFDLLQTDLQVLGDYDQTFMFEKNDKKEIEFKLLQKYSYSKFGNSLVNKIITEHLIPLLQSNFSNIKSEILQGTSNDLIKILSVNIKSPKQLKIKISELNKQGIISPKLTFFLTNYIKGYELLYTLKLSEVNPSLTDINYQNFVQYQNEYIGQLENKLSNLQFTNDRLPYLNISFDFQNSSLSEIQIAEVVRNIVKNKENKIKDKEITIPKEVKGNLNPVYFNQLGYAEGVLNFFKEKINLIENLEGDIDLNSINLTSFGPDLFFNLSDKNQIEGINYIDEDYIKLENEAKNIANSTKQKIAETKLKIIKYIQDYNIQNNLPSNYVKEKFKYNNSQFLSDDLNKRNFLNVVFRIIPSAFISTVSSISPYYGASIYYWSMIGIDQFIKISYFLRKNNFNVLKALKLFFNSNIKEEYRVENYDVETTKSEEKSLFKSLKQLFTNLKERVDSRFVSNVEDTDVIDNNAFLFGESEIPKPFAKSSLDKSQLSTDGLADFKTFMQEMSNYETNVRWESWIRMAGEFQRMREGFNSLNLINLIRDRFWFNKFYDKGGSIKIARSITSLFSKKALTGNIRAAELNAWLGNLGALIHSDPIVFTKAFINNLRDVSSKIYAASNAKNIFNDFLNAFTGSNSEKSRLAFFQTLADTFLGKNTALIDKRVSVTSHIKKYLKSKRGTGFTVFDESENYLINISQATDSQGLQNIGEKQITNQIIFQYFLSNPLVDKFNNPIKNIQNYLVIKEGKIALDRDKLKIDKIYTKNSSKLKIPDYSTIDITLDKGFSEMTLEELNIEPLTDLELDIFLNETMLDEINNLQQKSQGVYDIFNKAYWRNSFAGILLLQFRDYVLPILTTSINSKKISSDFTSYERGIINSLSNLIVRSVKRNNFNADSYQNVLLLNNLDYNILLRDNAFLKYILEKMQNSNIDKKLKELAKDNDNYRQLVKKDGNNEPLPLTLDILNNLIPITYLQKFENKSDDDLIKNISDIFYTNNPEKIKILKKLLDNKFKDKIPFDNDLLEKLKFLEIQENYSEILENYNKLQNEISGDIKALNRLSNIIFLFLFNAALLTVVTAIKGIGDDEEKKKKKNKKNSFLDDFLSFLDYVSIEISNVNSNLIANFSVIFEMDAYGYNSTNNEIELNKTVPVLGDLFNLFKSFDIFWDSESKMTSIKKIRERERIYKLSKGNVPLLKPTLKVNKKTKKLELQDNIEFKESFLKLFIPKNVSDNFKIYKNKSDSKKYKEQKDLDFLDLMINQAKNVKFAKFSGIYLSPEKQDKLSKKLKESNKRIEKMKEEFENDKNKE